MDAFLDVLDDDVFVFDELDLPDGAVHKVVGSRYLGQLSLCGCRVLCVSG